MKLKCPARLCTRPAPLEWITISSSNAGTVTTCVRCGAYLKIPLPVDLPLWKMAQATFVLEHENCPSQSSKEFHHAHKNQNPAKKYFC